ncbi:hypothetical protein [Bacteriovorax sp. DB6_IX]|uniref:hypothetical protein n=1 Tax=Bacteriovorax sp. DB6_IX TaxID=1353530 RepID=UPI00038A403B|nr:hypothetical protein [Bacteriovorax sp. DB6_IX]EQC50616.1 hypothetical protein M901_1917 [Bacteriovorax sp. DB6_IX]
MKTIKLMPLLVSFTLVHSSMANPTYSSYLTGEYGADKQEFNYNGINREAIAAAASGATRGLGFGGIFVKAGQDFGSGEFNYSNEFRGNPLQTLSPDTDPNYIPPSRFDSGELKILTINSNDLISCGGIDTSIDLPFQKEFLDAACQHETDTRAKYCGCVQKKVKDLNLAEEYKGKDTKKMVEDNVSTMKKAYLVYTAAQALESFMSNSEGTAYAMLVNPQANKKILEMSGGDKSSLCIPGNAMALMNSLKNSQGKSCFPEEVKKEMKGLFGMILKKNIDLYPNMRRFMSGIDSSTDFNSYFREVDDRVRMKFYADLEDLAVDGSAGTMGYLKAREYFQDNIEWKSIGDLVLNPGEVEAMVNPAKYLNYHELYNIGKDAHTGKTSSFFMTYDQASKLRTIENAYLNDPLLRQKFYSYMYEQARHEDLEKNTQSSSDPLLRLGYSKLDYDSSHIERATGMTEERSLTMDALQMVASDMYRVAADGKDITADEFAKQLEQFQSEAAVMKASRCNEAFEKVRQACDMDDTQIVKEQIKNPIVLKNVVNSIASALPQDEHSDNDFVKYNIQAGAIACNIWSPKNDENSNWANALYDSTSNSEFTADVFEKSERISVTEQMAIASDSTSEEGGTGGSQSVIQATDEEYSAITGFMDSTADAITNMKTSIGSAISNNVGTYSNYFPTTSNLGNDRNKNSGSAQAEAQASQAQAAQDEALIASYNAKIDAMQQRLEEMNKKLEEAEKKKQQEEMAKLNKAISSATETINRLQADKKKLVQKLSQGPSASNIAQATSGPSSQTATRAATVDRVPEVEAQAAGGSSVAAPGSANSAGGSFARSSGKGLSLDSNGMTSDDYLYQLREGSMEGQVGTVLTLSSLKDPSIGNQVRNAVKSGDKVIYANVNGAVYRIIPQVDENGNIIEKGGEVVYVTEVVGGEIDSELLEMQEEGIAKKPMKKGARAPASQGPGMTQQGQSDDVKFGYDAMMNLTEEALEK